jgi:glycosyltransferase involved in cell wall biosynthesis
MLALSTRNNNKIFFDISSLIKYRHATLSGIQRVVTEIIPRFQQFYKADLIFASWTDRASGKYHCLPIAQLPPNYFSPHSHMEETGYPLARYSTKPIKHALYRAKLDLSLALNHDKPFKRFHITPQAWRSVRKNKSSRPKAPFAQLKGSKIEEIASPGDRIIILDSAWQNDHTEPFRKAQRDGLTVFLMVHDLIPILFPDTVGRAMPQIFAKWLLNSQNYTSVYLANSECTYKDLTQFLSTHKSHHDVRCIPLAQEIVRPPPERSKLTSNDLSIDAETYPLFADVALFRADVRQVAASDFALCVGTIEARKNVWRIATAWKQLLDQGRHEQLPKLVFAGRSGWLNDDFKNMMTATGNIWGWARVVEGPTDAELDLLYRRCRFFIQASLYEGWGLPVGEALSYGKTGVVSNAGSLPEVGGDLVEYCCPKSIDSIAAAVWRLSSDVNHKRALETKVQNTKFRTWDDVTQDLADAVLRNL